jgi:2-polyprenyl-6-methoxyphenol hydroxylase-like FAD-dependent oxidoreductase
MGLIFPQGGGRVRAYSAFRGDDAERLDGAGAYDRFVEACVETGIAAETYANATVQGPLATFDCDDNFVPHPHRDGVVLIGDAAATTDPTWGQGLSLGFRDARVLRDELLSDEDWQAAADRYAEEHDRYVDVTVRAEGWMQQVFLDGGLEADRRRERALPLIAADPTRVPDHAFSGPDLPAGDDVRRRFFGED